MDLTEDQALIVKLIGMLQEENQDVRRVAIADINWYFRKMDEMDLDETDSTEDLALIVKLIVGSVWKGHRGMVKNLALIVKLIGILGGENQEVREATIKKINWLYETRNAKFKEEDRGERELKKNQCRVIRFQSIAR
ncbi:hypothetical protein [Candidatus Kuenenia sp.]|uniref:hypothetical protein n=1 Tax=Candidatus Kuenenia sp. TaxID=2499824 RepID=UPI0032203949